jgi:muconate cycloisomerase
MKITKIRTTPLGIPFKQEYHWQTGVGRGATTILIEVETDEGATGIGESCTWFAAPAIVAAYEDLQYIFLGQSPFDIERLFARAKHVAYLDVTRRFGNRLFAGLEMALWDLIGKVCGQPVHRLMGGKAHDQIQYFGFVQGDTADELAASARRYAEAGYDVVYLKVGRGQEADMENVAAVRDAIGDRRLRLDANEAWDTLTAIRMIRMLSRFDPEMIEQPVPNQSLEGLRQVKESVDIPIAADQCALTLGDVYEICRRRAADLIVIGPHESGGLLELKKIAAIAEAAGINICMHGVFETGITTCAANQVLAAIPNLDDGNQIMCQLLDRDIVGTPKLSPEKGRLPVFEGPGLGFELDHQAVEEARECFKEHGQFHVGG